MDLNQQKEQFSGAYLRAVMSVAGYTVGTREVDDDSIDFTVSARGGGGTPRRPMFDLQLKCTSRDVLRSNGIHFRRSAKNYDDLRPEDLLAPRLLIVVVVPERPDDWITQSEDQMALRHCGYWLSLRGMPSRDDQETITVVLPRTQILTPSAVTQFMKRINDRQPL